MAAFVHNIMSRLGYMYMYMYNVRGMEDKVATCIVYMYT